MRNNAANKDVGVHREFHTHIVILFITGYLFLLKCNHMLVDQWGIVFLFAISISVF